MAGVVVVSPVVVSDGYGNLINVNHSGRLLTDASGSTISVGATFPSDPSRIVKKYFSNGSSDSMLVNGSVTPQVFAVEADGYDDIRVYELRMWFIDNAIKFDGGSFGDANTLTNGTLVEFVKDGVATSFMNIKQNEDFFAFAFPGTTPFVDLTGGTDILVTSANINGAVVLTKNSTDMVRITVRDNLTSFSYFKCMFYGLKE